MGIKERHERERQAVARAILDAARALFVSEGYRRVSMRRIAERIEYSPAAIYRYFRSKDDIFFALAEEGFLLLSDRARATLRARDPVEAIRRTFLGFYDFSCEHPEYFALMFLDRSVPHIRKHWERFSFIRDTKGLLAARFRECQDQGRLPPHLDLEAAFNVLVAAIHGVATMRLCDRPALGDQADALARDVIEVALAGLGAGTPLRFRGTHGTACQPGIPTAGLAATAVEPAGMSSARPRRRLHSPRGSS